MSRLLSAREFYSQPQEAAEIDWGEPLASGLVQAMVGSNPLFPALGGQVTTSGTVDNVVGTGARRVYSAGASGSGRYLLPHSGFNTDSFSFACKFKSLATSGVGVAVRPASSTILLWRATGKFDIRLGGRDYTAAGTFDLLQDYVYIVTSGPSGVTVTANGVDVISSGTTALSSSVTADIPFGFDTFGGGSHDIEIETAALWHRPLSALERRLYSENPYRLYRAPSLPLFFDAAAGGALSLVVQDATHGHTSDALTMAATLALATNEATHAHTADIDSVTAGYALAVAGAAHAHAADNLDVVAGAVLATDAAAHAHTSGAPALTIVAGLQVADAAHTHTSSTLALTATLGLAVADALHAHSADNVGVDTGGALTVQGAAHAHTADQITLTAALGLAVDSAGHGHTTEVLTLGAVLALVVADATHAHTSDNLTLDTALALEVASALHAHAAESPTLSIGATLAIADALHVHAAEGLMLAAALTLAVQEALHTHAADNLSMTVSGAGVSLSAEDIAAIADAVWNHPKALTFQRFIGTKDL